MGSEFLLAFAASLAANTIGRVWRLGRWMGREVRKRMSRWIVSFIGPELKRRQRRTVTATVLADGVLWRDRPSLIAGIHATPQCPTHKIDLLFQPRLGEISELENEFVISDDPAGLGDPLSTGFLYCPAGEGHTLLFTQSSTVREAKKRLKSFSWPYTPSRTERPHRGVRHQRSLHLRCRPRPPTGAA